MITSTAKLSHLNSLELIELIKNTTMVGRGRHTCHVPELGNNVEAFHQILKFTSGT